MAFLNTIKIILENSILKYGLNRKGTIPWWGQLEQNGANN